MLMQLVLSSDFCLLISERPLTLPSPPLRGGEGVPVLPARLLRQHRRCVCIGGGGEALLYAASPNSRFQVVSVIASNVRKGNVIEKDGKLYIVVTAENIHPGKGTPVTQLEMRRISDGVKISDRYKTTDTLE